MSQTFTIKRGDTSPALRFALLPETINLNGATVAFTMRQAGASAKIDRAAASVVTGASPVVEYAWGEGDTDTAGFFQAEFEVTYFDGSVETFPNDEYLYVNIIGDLG